MIIDNDLVRTILMQTGEKGHDPLNTIDDFDIDCVKNEILWYHIWLLRDGGFILAEMIPTDDGSAAWVPKVLTYKGQQYLLSIRDKEIWAQTKKLAKQGGIEGLKAIGKIAAKVGKAEFERRTGIDLD